MVFYAIVSLVLYTLLPLWANHEDAENVDSPVHYKQTTTVVMVCENHVKPSEVISTKPKNKPQPRGPQQLRVQVWRSMVPQSTELSIQQTSTGGDDQPPLDSFLIPDEPPIPPIIVSGNDVPSSEEEVNMATLSAGAACMEVSDKGVNHITQPLYVTNAHTQTLSLR